MTTTARFRRRHDGLHSLVLVNAWDAGTVRRAEAGGAQAEATCNGAIAWSMGKADGEHLTWKCMRIA